MHNSLINAIRQRVNLTDEEAATFERFFIPRRYRKRQYVLNAGDKCQYLLFVANGLLRSFTVSDDGDEHVMQFAMEGAWITDMGSFINAIRQRVNLTDEEAATFERIFIPLRYRKRQYVLNAGDKCQYLLFVANGLLRSFTVSDDGDEHVMQFAMEGAWITDMGSFL